MGDEINGFHLSSKCTKIMWNLKRGSGHTTFLIKYQNRVNLWFQLSRRNPPPLSISVGGGYDKLYSVGVQAPTVLNAPRGCARIRTGICLLKQTRIRRARLASESWR